MAEVALAAQGQVQQGGAVGGASTRGAGPSATSGSTDASSAAGGAPRLLRGVLVHRSRAGSEHSQKRKNPCTIVSIPRCRGFYRA